MFPSLDFVRILYKAQNIWFYLHWTESMFNVKFVEAEHMKCLIKILKINLLTGIIIIANTNIDPSS